MTMTMKKMASLEDDTPAAGAAGGVLGTLKDRVEETLRDADDNSPPASPPAVGLNVQVPAGGETEDDYGGDFEDGDGETEAESPAGKSASKDAYGDDDFEDGGSPGAASEGKLKSGYQDDFEASGFEESQFEPPDDQAMTQGEGYDDGFEDDNEQ